MKKIILAVLAISAVITGTLFNSSAQAYKQSDVDKLLSTKQCPNCDLSEANLIGANLSGANLSGANLSGAILDWVTLDINPFGFPL
jgi:uncharacterized protein YjbI with pentapeptide repeats